MHEHLPKIIAEKSICDPHRPNFSKLKPVLPEMITRTLAESRPSGFSLRFLSCKSYFLAEFWKTYLEKVVVLSEAFLLVYDTWWYLNIKYDFLSSKGRNQGKNH